MPTTEVLAEGKAIREELRKYCDLPEEIDNAITLLKNTKPYLKAIKKKLGSSNSFYRKISTQVVENALHNVITEVNKVQENIKNTYEKIDETYKRIEWLKKRIGYMIKFYHDPKLEAEYDRIKRLQRNSGLLKQKLQGLLEKAWKATRIMDKFDMENEFNVKRYKPNRDVLKGLCKDSSVTTDTKTDFIIIVGTIVIILIICLLIVIFSVSVYEH